MPRIPFALTAALVAAACSPAITACSTTSRTLIAPSSEALADMHDKSDVVAACRATPSLTRPLVVGNYNIKSGVWTSLDEVGGVLEKMDADVVALEEVDQGMKRSGGVDESAVLAKRLQAEHVFAGTLGFDGGTYGIALLSKLPIVKVTRFDLPRANGFEPRVAIDATVCAGTTPLRVIAAHADFLPWAAEAQAKAIAAYIGDDKDVLVLGDFNATPTDDGMQVLAKPRGDALAKYDEGPTFPGTKSRIDFILTGRGVKNAKRIITNASDHYPVTATLDVGGAGAGSPMLATSSATPTPATAAR
jgi:endonuclease/exonuclease/phosphatase family metal-dependent hydrolase